MSNFDSGSTLPEADTSGQTQVVVLPDGGVVQVTVTPDGSLVLADGGGLILGLDSGGISGGGLFNLKCDAGAITVFGDPKTVVCKVLLSDGSEAKNVLWVAQDTIVGSMGTDGVFRANGWVGGVVEVTAKVGSASFSTKITVDFKRQDNPGGLSSGDVTKLVSGGTSDAGFKWLYPYDKTVFPRGLQPPLLQLGGTAASGSYLKITAPHFLYEAFNGASNPLQISIPPDVWKGLTYTAGGTDWVSVSVSKLSSGNVTGPVTEQWLIAQGKLKGIVYYNTYNSVTNPGFGAIIRVPLGGQANTLLTNSACGVVCHSVSANGKVLSTGVGITQTSTSSAVYDLDTAGNATLRPAGIVPGSLWHFAALTPDGTAGITNNSHNMPSQLYYDTVTAGLVDTASYNYISAPSYTLIYPHMPIFSPDGKKLAYVDGDQGTKGFSWILSVMDSDLGQTPPVFSNSRNVFSGLSGQEWVAWPSFLPDANAIVFHQGRTWQTNKGTGANLRLVDLQNGNAANSLNALNGFDSSGNVYLPYGATEDGSLNYEPSALTIAIGGYYWVMFTSRRSYGNTIWTGGLGGIDKYASGSPRKKIWVSAVDIDYASKTDPSHPAFYLDGQELASGNMRPFAALEPCRPEGAACETGSDCCQGYCRETGRDASGTPILQCVPPPSGSCSQLDEVCITPADCCDPTNLCVGGRCAIPTPMIF
ncbi:MAG TPA: hypothetical protein VGJ84_04410 [Polyangiaceae bacterium]